MVVAALLVAQSTAPSTAAGSASALSAEGDPEAMPSAYGWLDDHTPTDTYSITVVRGRGPKAVLRILGGVKKELPPQDPGEAEGYLFDHLDMSTYTGPRVAQVQRHGKAVVVYQPYDFPTDAALARLSRKGVVACFFTTVELDTYATVARGGEVIRQFDVGSRPPAEGALPQEEGLDFGKPHQNLWATGWAFNERLTLTHISLKWFGRDHPTYVLRKPG